MDWAVSLLPKADADLESLPQGTQREALTADLLAEFAGMKAERLDKLFRQGVSTSSIDRLSGSRFPGSIRIHVFADFRATALCLPKFRQAYVTHIFHKSADPLYRKAVATHDTRAAEFVQDFNAFLGRRI